MSKIQNNYMCVLYYHVSTKFLNKKWVALKEYLRRN